MSRPDVRPLPETPTDEQLIESLVQTISGFQPAMTGGLCDACPAAFSEGDRVHVDLWLRNGTWHMTGTVCFDHDRNAHHGDGMATNAVVVCELGAEVGGEWYPLQNPEVVDLHNGGRT